MACVVMLIEDSRDTRELYQLALEGNGFDLECYGNATDALARIEAGYVPNLVLCDLRMPGLSGDQFITILRDNPSWAHVRVIVVSGIDDLKKRADEMGADDYLKKPFDLERLETTVNDHIRAVC